MFTEFCITARH